MTYDGRVQNGVIVLEGAAKLAEGARVCVETVEGEVLAGSGHESPLTALLSLAGSIAGPADWSWNHDHNIHGKVKK